MRKRGIEKYCILKCLEVCLFKHAPPPYPPLYGIPPPYMRLRGAKNTVVRPMQGGLSSVGGNEHGDNSNGE